MPTRQETILDPSREGFPSDSQGTFSVSACVDLHPDAVSVAKNVLE